MIEDIIIKYKFALYTTLLIVFICAYRNVVNMSIQLLFGFWTIQ